MMSIKKRKRKNITIIINKTLRQEFKELIDIIGHREIQEYRDGCLDDICKVLQQHIDTKIKNWQESFEHHRIKEEEWKSNGNWEFMDLHHSMKVYSNGAAHSLQFFKDELLIKK